jgi:O-methyltransferase
MKSVIRRFAARLGYEVNARPWPRYGDAHAFDRAAAIVEGATMLARGRLLSLYEQVVYCEGTGLRGAFVECGVWKGGAVGLMARAALDCSGGDRDLHLFDSFEGICEPDPDVDGEKAIREIGYRPDLSDGVIKPVKGVYDSVGGHGTMAECRDLIERRIGYSSERVHFHVGWFQDTVPVASSSLGSIALLRLDGDWYASTKVCLDHLYDLVVPGGFVIFDDYGTYEGCRKATDEFLQSRGVATFMHRVDRDCFYLVKPGS